MRPVSVATLLTLALSILFTTAVRADERLPLTNLVMRERVIKITNSPKGLLYSVSTKDGTVLDTHLSEAQLQAKYPDAYENIRPAFANDVYKNIRPASANNQGKHLIIMQRL